MVFAFPWLWGLPLAFLRARGGSVGRLPLLCVCSDVSRSAASCARGGGACFWRLCCARGLALNYCGLQCGLRDGGVVGRRRRRVLPCVVGDWDVCGRMVAFWGAKVAN